MSFGMGQKVFSGNFHYPARVPNKYCEWLSAQRAISIGSPLRQNGKYLLARAETTTAYSFGDYFRGRASQLTPWFFGGRQQR